MRRMYELSAAYIDTCVSYIATVYRCEKDYVPDLKVRRGNRGAGVYEARRGAVYRVSEVPVAVV